MGEAVARVLKAAKASGQSEFAASILQNGKIIATGENETHLQCDPTKHAEMVAIMRASRALETTGLSN